MGNNLVLPVNGQTAWGDLLNAAVNQSDNDALQAQTSLSNHAANSPADPHGDRSYAQGLVSPITSGVNLANGYVKLNSSGTVPPALITGSGGPGGMYTAIFDAVATYGMVSGNSDSSAACQNACNAAGSAGGGIVWIGPGTFSFNNYVVIPTGVWVMMSEGTTINRIAGGTTPKYLFTNVEFGTNNTPSTNIKITGGRLNAVGPAGLSSQCTPIFIIQSTRTVIDDVFIYGVYSNVAIELNGCTDAYISRCTFDGVNKATSSSFITPAIRINISNTSTTPTGLLNTLYNQSVCNSITVVGCVINNKLPGEFGPFGTLVASDLTVNGQALHENITVTGCQMPYPAASGPSSIVSNNVWNFYNVQGNTLSEGTWVPMVGSNGFSASGFGSNPQWRPVCLGMNGVSGGLTINSFGSADTVEVIGDCVTGVNVANGAVAFTLTGLPSGLFNSGQIVPVTFTGATAPAGVRLFYTGNTLEAENMSSLNSQRFVFHAFLSMNA